jgi:hypothetical protein
MRPARLDRDLSAVVLARPWLYTHHPPCSPGGPRCGSVALPAAGYDYNSVWTPLLAGLSPARMACNSLAALIRPCVARGFPELSVCASMYPASDWSRAPGHHGYRRACVPITGQASSWAIRVTRFRKRREDRSSISSHPLAHDRHSRKLKMRTAGASHGLVRLHSSRSVPWLPGRGTVAAAPPRPARTERDIRAGPCPCA